ncbi:MAG: YlxM family DNA-binding protein [Firmicutes bacterium]|nr:YlxM family DNA-binding protein [Bacillota bacterium]
MTKDLSVSVLMDFYGELLTQKQIEALNGYYNQDLSLAEIAEEMDISRQGVRDFIKKGELHLIEFEEKLGLAEKFLSIRKTADDMSEIIAKMPQNGSTARLLGSLDEIVKQL